MSTAPRSQAARRFWGDDDSETPILHVDMDSFFAAVEIAVSPALAGRPLIIGGKSGRGVVTSCTYDVRALGVRAGMPIRRAMSLAPQAQVVAGNHRLYRDYSHRVMEIVASITPDFEPVSIDEAYLDVSGARRRLGSPVAIGELLRTRIRAEVGLPASVGIGANKMVAKIASAHAKPDGLLLVPGAKTESFLHSLPVGAIPGVGKKVNEVLERIGIETVAQLASAPRERLVRHFGPAQAHALLDAAHGVDRRKVERGAPEKSISTEETFETNLTRRDDVEAFLLRASHAVATRLRRQALTAWTVHIKMRDGEFHTITRSTTLGAPTDLSRTISQTALTMFRKETIGPGGVRLAGVGVSMLSPRAEGVQASLDDDPKPLAAERAMDAVNDKFGPSALHPATLLGRE